MAQKPRENKATAGREKVPERWSAQQKTEVVLGDVRVAFHKRDTFADERELRFVFDTGTTGTDAIKLNIGDIRDIARPIDPEDPTRVLFRLGQA